MVGSFRAETTTNKVMWQVHSKQALLHWNNWQYIANQVKDHSKISFYWNQHRLWSLGSSTVWGRFWGFGSNSNVWTPLCAYDKVARKIVEVVYTQYFQIESNYDLWKPWWNSSDKCFAPCVSCCFFFPPVFMLWGRSFAMGRQKK